MRYNFYIIYPYISGIDSVMQTHRNRNSRQVPVNDIIGVFLNVFVVGLGTLSPLFVLVGIATDMDPFYFVFEQLILPTPYYRSLAVIVAAPLARFLMGLIATLECIRFGSALLISLIVTVFTALSIIEKLKSIHHGKSFSLYVQLRLVCSAVEPFTSSLSFAAIFGSQYFIVLLLWLVFKCYTYMPTYIYYADLLLAISVIIIVTLVLPTLSKIESRSGAFVQASCNGRFLGKSKPKFRRKCYSYWLWTAQKNVYLSCGCFFKLEGNVTMTYFRELINNLVNAVILIEPISF